LPYLLLGVGSVADELRFLDGLLDAGAGTETEVLAGARHLAVDLEARRDEEKEVPRSDPSHTLVFCLRRLDAAIESRVPTGEVALRTYLADLAPVSRLRRVSWVVGEAAICCSALGADDRTAPVKSAFAGGAEVTLPGVSGEHHVTQWYFAVAVGALSRLSHQLTSFRGVV